MYETNEVFIVDLAGRENEKTTQATGERLVELSFINKSLFHLANCIAALGGKGPNAARQAKARRQAAAAFSKLQEGGQTPTETDTGGSHGSYAKLHNAATSPPGTSSPPGATTSATHSVNFAQFRNSKLTLVLSEALSGNSRTFMIGTLSPAMSALDENQVTLRFAANVKNIKLRAVKIESSRGEQEKALGGEIAELRKRLAAAQGDHPGQIQFLKDELAAFQLAAEEHGLNWDEIVTKGRRNGWPRRNGIAAGPPFSSKSCPKLSLANASLTTHLLRKSSHTVRIAYAAV